MAFFLISICDTSLPFCETRRSPHLCEFRSHYLTYLTDKAELLKSGVVSTVLMDFSKAFDCLFHDLDYDSVRLRQSYLSKNKTCLNF